MIAQKAETDASFARNTSSIGWKYIIHLFNLYHPHVGTISSTRQNYILQPLDLYLPKVENAWGMNNMQ